MGFLAKKDPIADLSRAVEKNPKDTRSALELAGQLAKKGDVAGAVDRYIRAGRVFQGEGFHQKAAAAAKQALALSPRNIEAHEFLADLYEAVKLKEDARTVLKKLLDLYFDNKDSEAVTRTRKRIEALGPGR